MRKKDKQKIPAMGAWKEWSEFYDICAFCHKGDKDFRDPKLYKLHEIIDPLDRDNRLLAHKQCIVDAGSDYYDLSQLKIIFGKLVR